MSTDPKPWHADPLLTGRFHPQHPDDLEATFVHLAKKTLEKMWVRIDEVVPKIGYEAQLLNTSKVVPSLTAGARVQVRPSKSHPPLLWVPPGAATENLRAWSSVCSACGFDLVFMPIEELAKLQFPDSPPDHELLQFTTRCLMCRLAMVVQRTSEPS